MQHVQNSEMSVESKKKHCKPNESLMNRCLKLTTCGSEDEEVVKAFQSALALLNAQMKA